jgi:cobaltochelatase CobN
LIDKAIRLAAAQAEPDNHVAEGTRSLREALLRRGFSEGNAERYAASRIFGTKPGNMSGTHILHLIPRSGVWENEDEVSGVYIDNMSFVYTGDTWGEQIDGLYEEAIQGTDTLIRVWASNMTSQLSNHHAYEYLGGLSMAVKRLTGREPEALIADVRDAGGARMREFKEVLAVNLRSELLNRKWIIGMMEHEYAGAGHITELVKNTFGWSVTRSSSVDNWAWDEIDRVYIQDQFELELQEWFQRHNPHARQEVLATLMEASRKGYWDADEKRIRELAKAFAESVVENGLSAGLVTGGNDRLEEAVQKHLQGPGDSALATQFQEKIQDSEGRAENSGTTKVRGRKLEKQEASPPIPPSSDTEFNWFRLLFALGCVLLLWMGIATKSGGAK